MPGACLRMGSAGVLLLWLLSLYFPQIIFLYSGGLLVGCLFLGVCLGFFPPLIFGVETAVMKVFCPLVAQGCFWSCGYLKQNANLLDAQGVGQQWVPALSAHLLSRMTLKCDTIVFGCGGVLVFWVFFPSPKNKVVCLLFRYVGLFMLVKW